MTMENQYYSLPDEAYLATRQTYVQRFTLIYSSTTLVFSAYFSPQDFNFKVALIINVLLFLIGAPYWFRKTSIPHLYLNVLSQVSNAFASIWICSFLGPTSHINLVAIPQFILVLMMFGGKYRLLSWTLGAICVFQLSLPLFPFVNTWYLNKRMPEEHLVILRELIDLLILILTIYQFRVISEAWRDALVIVKDEKQKLQTESEWRFRLLRILSHDIKEPMLSALQLLRKIRRGAKEDLDPRLINQLENSQMMIREIISNVESYASAHQDLQLPRVWLSPQEVLEKIMPWLKSRLEEKLISISDSNISENHRIWVNPEAFIYQVFLNILSNAIKFSPAGSKIDFSSEQMGQTVIWKIRDQGKGINPEAFSERNFSEPGTQGESGSGLGIRIANLIAHKQDLELIWKKMDQPQTGTEVSIVSRSL